MMMSAVAAVRHRSNWLSRGGGLICRSLATQSAAEQLIPYPYPPWVLVTCPLNLESRYLYALTKDKDKDSSAETRRRSSIQLALDEELRIPDIASNWIIGCSQGFLISMPVRSVVPRDIVAINPVSCDRYDIPISCHLFGRVKACKAILSPSLDTLVLLPNFRTKKVGLANLRLAQPCSPWTFLNLPSCFSEDVHDCVFHKGNLYLTDAVSSVVTFGCRPSYFIWKYVHDLEEDERIDRNILLESPEGDHLYLLVKTTKKNAKDENKFYFTAYKLDEESGSWNHLESIGDLAVFVARNGAISLHAQYYPPLLKPNCIYYFGDDCRYKPKPNISGVYYLKSKRFKHIGVISDGDHNFLAPTHPSPLLFQPETPPEIPDIAQD